MAPSLVSFCEQLFGRQIQKRREIESGQQDLRDRLMAAFCLELQCIGQYGTDLETSEHLERFSNLVT